jgi:TonB family protein
MEDKRNARTGPEPGTYEMALGRCLVDGDPEAMSSARRTRRKTFGFSLAIELSLLLLLVAAPLLSSGAQPHLRQILPPQLAFFGVWRGRNPVQRLAPSTIFRKPEIPNPFPHADTSGSTVSAPRAEEPGEPSLQDMPGGYVPGTVQIAETGRMPPPVEPPHIVQPPQQEKRPMKLSEGVLEAQLISRVEPQYPSIAVQTKTQGAVRLHAIINREGHIISLDVLSGHPLLVKAALDAVRLWRYRPTMLNGQPVEVETSITVIFRLHE